MYVKEDSSENMLKRKKLPWLYLNRPTDTMRSVVLTAVLGDSSPAAGLGSPDCGGLEMGWRTPVLSWSCFSVKLGNG